MILENLQPFEVGSHAREDTLLHLSAEDAELSASDLAGWEFHLNRIAETPAELFIKLTVSQCSVIEPFPFEEQSFEGFQLSARVYCAESSLYERECLYSSVAHESLSETERYVDSFPDVLIHPSTLCAPLLMPLESLLSCSSTG